MKDSPPSSVYSRDNLFAIWNTFSAMVRKEFTILARYPVEFVASFLQIFLVVVILTFTGRVFTAREAASETKPVATQLVVYGFFLFIYFVDTLWSIGYNVRREQKQGTLEQLYLSPAFKAASLIARVTITLVWTGLLSIISALTIGSLFGHTLLFENVPLSAYIFVMALAGIFGTGFAFAALTLRIKETAQTLANLLQFVFMLLCAPFFPFSVLPPALRVITHLLPLSYAIDLFRSALMGFPPGFPELASVKVELAVVTVFGLFMPILGYRLYHWAENAVRRQGGLSEY